MLRIRVAGAALNQTPRDWGGNRKRNLKAIEQAREHEATVQAGTRTTGWNKD